ncbi:MAG: hypothetical protein KGJ08_02415 [Gammaproteobacteria bacterium]|nr:hypothetical protein [Gammaproteobacteria bacterium]
MNTTRKMIFAAAVTLNFAAIAIATGMVLRQQSQANTINLGAIVVTPADYDHRTVDLGTILVTPSDADWRYAEARGVQRPAMNSIALGSIIVRPTDEQLADVADTGLTSNTRATEYLTDTDASSTSLLEALEALTPRTYLDTTTTLRALDKLVFERSGG